MKTIILSIGISLLASLFAVLPASANNSTSLSQQIVPIDCVFDVVSTGPYQIVWVTPAECGVEVTPTDPNPPSGGENPANPTSPSQQPRLPYYYTLNPSPDPSAQPESPVNPGIGIIKLNLYPEYREGASYEGKKISLQQGQVIYFDAHGQSYSITVSEVAEYSVQLVISRLGAPNDDKNQVVQYITLIIGASGAYDVGGDDELDIRISLLDVTNGVAELKFKEMKTVRTDPSVRLVYVWWPLVLILPVSWVLFGVYRLVRSRLSS